jgi:dTDP-4-dehydrorhamnose 3,5-epimerase
MSFGQRIPFSRDELASPMHVEQTGIPGLLVMTPARFGDARGFFSESWNRARLAEHGIELDFVQDNHSLSAQAGTVRGLHFQAPPHAQAKLVRCGRGRLFDVAVDLRRGSPAYGRWFGVELSFENGKQLLIPAGFAHGFATREPDTEIVYKCSDYYAPETEGALRYDDPDIGIDWGIGDIEPILSEKDAAAGRLAAFDSPFTYRESAS